MNIFISQSIGFLAVSYGDISGEYFVFTSLHKHNHKLSIHISEMGLSFHFNELNINVVRDNSTFKLLLSNGEPSYFTFDNGLFTILIDGIKFFICSTNRSLEAILLPSHETDDNIEELKFTSRNVIYNENGTVSKIIHKKEWLIMKSLDIQDISIENISENEKTIIHREYPYLSKEFYKLTMPRIKGVNLYSYLNKFINPNSQLRIAIYSGTTIGIDRIDIDIVIKLCKSLINFYERIKIFNSEGKFHNDLHMSNCIYDEYSNEIKMIDYEFLTFVVPKSDYFDKYCTKLFDLNVIVMNIKFILLCGSLNYDFYTMLKQHGLISGNIYDIDMLVGVDFTKKLKAIL